MKSRYFRIFLGVAGILLGLYVILGEQFSGTSADAVVNAQVLILRAPVDGQLSLAVQELGARIGAKENIGNVADPRPDDTRLIDLQRAAEQSTLELKALNARNETLSIWLAGYQKQNEAYAGGRIRQIEARIAEATSLLEGAQAKLRDTDATFQRTAELGKRGFQSVAEQTRTRSAYEVSKKDVQAARDRIRLLNVELAAAKKGSFLGDANNDSPHSQQKIQELGLQIGQLKDDILQQNERLKSLNKQVDEEKLRLGRFTEARIDSPVPGILWEVMSGRGEYVRKAQDVVRIVDCTSTIVTASVRESVYNKLKVGDSAQFRLAANPTIYEGTVARLAGSGAQSIYRSLAIGPSEEHLKRFDVTLVVPDLKKDPKLACSVGRTGRVIFSAGPLEFWRRWIALFGWT